MKKNFRPIVFSRHPTHNILRKNLPLLPFRSVIRLGSTTKISENIQKKGIFIECNSIKGIINTSNKIYMKMNFVIAKINTPSWFLPTITTRINSTDIDVFTDRMSIPISFQNNFNQSEVGLNTKEIPISEVPFPLIAKINFHSRGRGMLKIDTKEELLKILKNPTQARKYTFEKYVNYVREYRVHATTEGIFYICRKLRQTSSSERWYFNSKNSIFQIVYENNKWRQNEDNIVCFKEMEQHCIKALNQLQMDIAGFDIRINSTGDKFTIIEANSACSFGEHTAQHYIEQIPKILQRKFENNIKI